jgi:hypothetical protein
VYAVFTDRGLDFDVRNTPVREFATIEIDMLLDPVYAAFCWIAIGFDQRPDDTVPPPCSQVRNFDGWSLITTLGLLCNGRDDSKLVKTATDWADFQWTHAKTLDEEHEIQTVFNMAMDHIAFHTIHPARLMSACREMHYLDPTWIRPTKLVRMRTGENEVCSISSPLWIRKWPHVRTHLQNELRKLWGETVPDSSRKRARINSGFVPLEEYNAEPLKLILSSFVFGDDRPSDCDTYGEYDLVSCPPEDMNERVFDQ